MDVQIERRIRFRRQSDRNFKVSITMMFILTFILAFSVGWYGAAAKADGVKKRACEESVR